MFRFIAFLSVIISTLSQPVRSPEIWATPIPDFVDRHYSNFYLPAESWGKGHRGIDMKVETNETLYAPFAGEIHFVGKVVDRQVVTLKSASGLLASFEPVCSELSNSEEIEKGQAFGFACQADDEYKSHCDGCVHFSVRSEFGYLNPLLFVSKIKPSVIVS